MPGSRREIVAWQLARSAAFAMLVRLHRDVTEGRVVVLLYHSVHPSSVHASVTPDVFRSHLEWLRAHCDVIPFREVLDQTSRSDPTRPTVAVTFDDGFIDNYRYAWPLLLEHEVPATFFVTTGLVEGNREVRNRFMRMLGATEEETVGLTWSQLREMLDSGMEVGAHTVSHANLAWEDVRAVRWEIEQAKDLLESRLEIPILSFAYPFGKPKHHFTSATMRIVEDVGFVMAAAVNYRGVRPDENPLHVPRFAITGDSLETLHAKVFGRFDALGAWQERAPRWLSHAISPERSMRGERSLVQG